MQNDNDETTWEIGYQDDKHRNEILIKANSTAELRKRWEDFERDVTVNPYHHTKYKRIVKLKDSTFPKGSWRYRNDPIRVVYYPEGSTKTIYPLAVDTVTGIAYKKKSTKRKKNPA